jgi:hypothetical protein
MGEGGGSRAGRGEACSDLRALQEVKVPSIFTRWTRRRRQRPSCAGRGGGDSDLRALQEAQVPAIFARRTGWRRQRPSRAGRGAGASDFRVQDEVAVVMRSGPVCEARRSAFWPVMPAQAGIQERGLDARTAGYPPARVGVSRALPDSRCKRVRGTRRRPHEGVVLAERCSNRSLRPTRCPMKRSGLSEATQKNGGHRHRWRCPPEGPLQ